MGYESGFLKKWYASNRCFSLTLDKDPFGDLAMEDIWKYLQNDLTLYSARQSPKATDRGLPQDLLYFPPVFLVKDLLHILQHYKDAHLLDIGARHEDLLHHYRNQFIYYFIYKDNSIAKLSQVFISKGRSERKYFVPFVIQQIARAIMDIHPFPFTNSQLQTLSEDQIETLLAEELRLFIDAFIQRKYLFAKDQLELLYYVRREQDIPLVQEYQKAKSQLAPMSVALAQRTRSSHSLKSELEEGESFSMGGISEITRGGAVEKITSIVPSELAMMEEHSNIDLFDVHLLENRLLFFSRDNYLLTRQYRDFHVVFFDSASLDFRPQTIPFRWQYLFMAILGDVICFYRDYFDVRTFSFHFALNQGDKADGLKLLEIIHDRDFPDVDMQIYQIARENLAEHLQELLSVEKSNQSLICFVRKGEEIPLEIPPEVTLVLVEYGGQRQVDEIRLKFCYRFVERNPGIMIYAEYPDVDKYRTPMDRAQAREKIDAQQEILHSRGPETIVYKESELPEMINKLRDKLFMCIAGSVE